MKESLYKDLFNIRNAVAEGDIPSATSLCKKSKRPDVLEEAFWHYMSLLSVIDLIKKHPEDADKLIAAQTSSRWGGKDLIVKDIFKMIRHRVRLEVRGNA
jgi:hypothetical protein